MEKELCVHYGQRRRYFDAKVTVRARRPFAQAAEPLLPPQQQQQHQKKVMLVLDLDETLAYIKCAEGCLFNCGCGEGCDFYVAKRPGVDAFLSSMAELYEVLLWTSAPQQYADSVLDTVLDPEGRVFSHRLYKQHLTAEGKKDLSRLGRDLRRLVMVDDCASKFPPALLLPNVVLIQRYISDGTQEDDDKLERLGKLLAQLLAQDDGKIDGTLQELKARGDLDDISGKNFRSSRGNGPWRPSWERGSPALKSANMVTLHSYQPVPSPPPASPNDVLCDGGVLVDH